MDQVDGAVITVPAHFNDVQRKAVIGAAAIADLPVLGLVEEPVAAALHYGVQHASHDQVLLVYDWGGGTFDATVLSMDARRVDVLDEARRDRARRERDRRPHCRNDPVAIRAGARGRRFS